jgi:TPR repeat protein
MKSVIFRTIQRHIAQGALMRHYKFAAIVVVSGLLAACTQSGHMNFDTTWDITGPSMYTSPDMIAAEASEGNSTAQRVLGGMYYWGNGGVEQSDEIAALWWKRAAANGDSMAAANLARLAAGQPVDGELHASVGREIAARLEDDAERLASNF